MMQKQRYCEMCIHDGYFPPGMQMKELILEMNQVSNYDVIEQYCEYIARQLDDLEKQRYQRLI
jgi:hypothetical protein